MLVVVLYDLVLSCVYCLLMYFYVFLVGFDGGNIVSNIIIDDDKIFFFCVIC